MVTVDSLTISFNKRLIIDTISVTLTTGSITSFIGPSGAGKTTILKAIAGLVSPDTGTIRIDSKNSSELTATQRAETIGYVFQNFNLFPHLTVLENCVDPLRVHRIPYRDACKRAQKILADVHMSDFFTYYPAQLSGGQQQRVAIARALCLNPAIILLDEPTASLDPDNTDRLVIIIRSLAHKGLTIGISSQDMGFVKKVFDRVYCIDQGKVIEFCDNKNEIAQHPLMSHWLQG